MQSPVLVPRPWHPLTFSSVAALAQTPFYRWQLLAGVVAVLGTASLLWFAFIGWRPVILESIHGLPEQCLIRQGILEWPGRSPIVLGSNPFLALVVDLEASEPSGAQADIQGELGKTQVKIRSLFGYISLPY